jgi:hypothetical protein
LGALVAYHERETGWCGSGTGTTSKSDDAKIVAYSQQDPMV